jgi:hypothetical protein
VPCCWSCWRPASRPTDDFARRLQEFERTRDVHPLVELFSDDAELSKLDGANVRHGRDGARRFWTEYREVFDDPRSQFTGDTRGRRHGERGRIAAVTGSPLLGPAETLLPEADTADVAAALAAGTDPRDVAAAHPASGLAWAELAERELLAPAGSPVTAYAYARTGYHRGLDALRRAGWRGAGPVPWRHGPNRGFLRSLRALAEAADRIGEADEAARCREFLTASDPAAPGEIGV